MNPKMRSARHDLGGEHHLAGTEKSFGVYLKITSSLVIIAFFKILRKKSKIFSDDLIFLWGKK